MDCNSVLLDVQQPETWVLSFFKKIKQVCTMKKSETLLILFIPEMFFCHLGFKRHFVQLFKYHLQPLFSKHSPAQEDNYNYF